MSRLNAFLDSEMEQVLCFNTAIDAEKFCNEKSAIFIVMPEENPNSFFMVSLLIQQFYREILAVADENGGKLPNRAMFYCDEFGTLPDHSILRDDVLCFSFKAALYRQHQRALKSSRITVRLPLRRFCTLQ